MNKKIVIIGILVLVGIALSIGYLLPHKITETVYVSNPYAYAPTVTLYWDKVQEKPPVTITVTNTINNTIERIVTNNVSVPVERIVNGKLVDFQSVGELTQWVSEHLTQFFGKADCDDYARLLQQNAYEDGYAISIQIIIDGKLAHQTVSDITQCHMGNLAIVGNNIYFIDVTDGGLKITLCSYVD
jgi:hypothetical protein